MKVQKGNPVEFTRKHVTNYIDHEGEIGIAIEDENSDGTVSVELADGSIYKAKYIHAFAWGGWLPDELEETYRKYNSSCDGPFDDWDD